MITSQRFPPVAAGSNVYFMNIGVDNRWGNHRPLLPQFSQADNTKTINSTEQLCYLIAGKDDIVIQRQPLSPILEESICAVKRFMPTTWIPEKAAIGLETSITESILDDPTIMDRLADTKASYGLVPYAVTSLEDQLSKKTHCPLVGMYSDCIGWLNNKRNARNLSLQLGLPVTAGFVCRTLDDFDIAVQRLGQEANCRCLVFKELYGASGKGMFLIENEQTLRFIRSMLARRFSVDEDFECLVEQWHETKIDLNYQIYVKKNRTLQYIPPKKQIMQRAVYTGSEFPVSAELTDTQIAYFEETAEVIGNELSKLGYEGLASIDAVITVDDVVIPVIEINARASLSTYVSFLSSYVGEEVKYLFRYYTLPAGIRLEDIGNMLAKHRYSHDSREGVMVCSFCEGVNDSSYGRVFLLMMSRDTARIKVLAEAVNRFFSTLDCKTREVQE